MEEEQHHWDDRRRIPDGGYPHGPPGPLGLLGVRPGMPPQPQGPAVSFLAQAKIKPFLLGGTVKNYKLLSATSLVSSGFFNKGFGKGKKTLYANEMVMVD